MFLLIDIYHNIAYAQGFFKCTAQCVSNVEMNFKPNSLCLSFCNYSCKRQDMNIKLPEKFLDPSSVSSDYSRIPSKVLCVIKCENDTKLKFEPLLAIESELSIKKSQEIEIAFRFQVSNTSLFKTDDGDCVNFKNFMYNKFQTMKTFHVVCTDCGGLLTDKSINFHSVLKYYEGVSELSENWFCHNHDDHQLSDVKANLESEKTSQHSLYIDDIYFYLHSSLLKSLMLSQTNKDYKCIKCSSVISLKKKMDIPYYIGFFSDKIMLVDSDREFDIENYKFNAALLSLCSIINDLLKTGLECKLYLQSKAGVTTEVILLWVNSQKVTQFLLHFDTEKDIPSEADFATKEVYKVLYCVCPSDSEVSKKWKHDFGVEFFQISDNMMNTVREFLLKTSEYFPKNEETMKGFSFGYLPVSTSLSL